MASRRPSRFSPRPLDRLLGAKRGRRPAGPAAGYSRRLRVESLEDRRMLATLTVDSALDNFDPDMPTTDGVVTLREAILAANTHVMVGDAPAGDPGLDTITFDPAVFDGMGNASRIRLVQGELRITEELTIDASMATAVTITGDAMGDDITVGMTNITDVAASFGGTAGAANDLLDDNSPVLNFSASTGNLTLEAITLTGGRTVSPFAVGAGILFSSGGNLTLTGSTVSGNSTADSFAAGAGIHTMSGNVTLTNSTVSGNSTAGFSGGGGGVYTMGGDVTLVGSTVSGNSTAGTGAGGGGVYTMGGDVTLVGSTVSGNSTSGTGAGGGGVSVRGSAAFTALNSIIAGNSVGVSQNGADLLLFAGATPTVDFSLIGDTAGSGIDETTGTGNLLNADPMLDVLADNGGVTQTLALLPGSPAINAGDPAFDPGATTPPLNTDQRGETRVQFGRVDIGAFEFADTTIPARGLIVDANSDTQNDDVFDGDYSPGQLSLREAIFLANANAGDNPITFDPAVFIPRPTISLTSGLPAITDTVSITSSTPVILDGAGIDADGLRIEGPGANGSIIQGLTIRGFLGDGIEINDSANNQIGGVGAGEANHITMNAGAGVAVVGATATGNTIRGNAIFQNTGPGIDLEPGANNDRAAPMLDGLATLAGGMATVTFDAGSNDALTIDFYLADANGQRQILLATTNSMMAGDQEFTFIAPPELTNGAVLVATATDAMGNTSEFSTTTTVINTGLQSVDVFLNGATGLLTISDRSGDAAGSQAQQANAVTLTAGQFSVGGTDTPGLFIDDPLGVNALATGAVQVTATRVFVPGTALTPTLAIDLQAGDDTLTIDVDGAGLIATPIFFDGGVGSDTLTTRGAPTIAVDTATYTPGLQPDEGRLTYDADPAVAGFDMVIDFDNLEPVVDLIAAANLQVNGNGADNAITYSEGTVETQGLVSIDGFETLEFSNKANLLIDGGAGGDTLIADNAGLPTGLQTITLNGGIGDDALRFENLPPAAPMLFSGATAAGGAGDDVIDGGSIAVDTTLTLDGGIGDDTITGGAGDDRVIGGAGDDTLVDSPGDDTYDGGDGGDVLVFRGTTASDVIDVFQTADASDAAPFQLALNTDLDPAAESTEALTASAGAPSVERVRIEGLEGDDLLRAGHADAFSDPGNAMMTAAQAVAFEVDGGGGVLDRLIVPDDGLGDLVIQRVGADGRSGSVTVGGLAAIAYAGVESTDVTPTNPITGGSGADGLGRLLVFKNDPFEPNDTLPNATFLGAGPTINVDPTIDPGGVPAFGIPGDNDFYRFVAQETGTLDVQLFFDPVGQLPNGRPGLPADGELTVTLLDSDGLPMAIATATDLTDAALNKIGERVTVPVVAGQTYFLRVEGQTIAGATGINVYNFTAVTTPAPTPELVDLQPASDTGRDNTDDITSDTTPTFDIVLDDDLIDAFMNVDLLPDTTNDNAQTIGFDYGVEVFNNGVSIGFAFFVGGNTWRFTAQAGDLTEGDANHISAAAWFRDRGDPAQVATAGASPALQVELDTTPPPVVFGLPTDSDGLADASDTGVATDPSTFADRVTSDTTPTFVGRAEADAVVRLFADQNNNSALDTTDPLIGQATAAPIDGNAAEPNGFWRIDSAADLNAVFGARDGLRRLFVTAEDVAGNGSAAPGAAQTLEITIDTQGPRVAAVSIPGAAYDLFDPKPSTNGPTPLISQLAIDFTEGAAGGQALLDLLFAQANAGLLASNFRVVGDRSGVIAVGNTQVQGLSVPTGPANEIQTRVLLTFASPLPDDRFTITVNDAIVDPAGNALDGESNASEPLENPGFPSGNGLAGGEFVARFTVDSRPEIGAFVAQNINLDTNGNFIWDPAASQIGGDATNTDLTFNLGYANAAGAIIPGGYSVHDLAFAGQFYTGAAGQAPPRLFDQLAAYGFSPAAGSHRWLIDANSDGVVTQGSGGDRFVAQPAIGGFNTAAALPVAGNFDGNAANGDEVGLYFAGRWALDVNRNFRIDPFEVRGQGNLLGHPVVGDFDGNGTDDFAVFNGNQFFFDLTGDFFFDASFVFGFPGVLDRPVATDFDQDGVDDIGLFVPRNSAQPVNGLAEWYLLVSGDPSGANRVAGTVNTLNHPFETVPFGSDLFAQFGSDLALPIVGNFDPPVAASEPPVTNAIIDGDYDRSGVVDADDYLVWREAFGTSNTAADGNGDGVVDVADFTIWRDNLGATAGPAVGALTIEPPAPPLGESAPPPRVALLTGAELDRDEGFAAYPAAAAAPYVGSDDDLLLLAEAPGEPDPRSAASPPARRRNAAETEEASDDPLDAFFAELSPLR